MLRVRIDGGVDWSRTPGCGSMHSVAAGAGLCDSQGLASYAHVTQISPVGKGKLRLEASITTRHQQLEARPL